MQKFTFSINALIVFVFSITCFNNANSQGLEFVHDVVNNTAVLTQARATADKGWVLGGNYTPSNSDEGKRGFILKLNSEGDLLWEYLFPVKDVSVESIIELSNGDFFVVTSDYSCANSMLTQPNIHKISKTGVGIWTKNIDFGLSCSLPNGSFLKCNRLKKSAQNTYYVGGGGAFGTTPYYLRYEIFDGSLGWSLYNGPESIDYIPIIGSQTLISVSSAPEIRKINYAGNIVDTYTSPYIDYYNILEQLPNGDVVGMGTHTLVKTNQNFDALNDFNFGLNVDLKNFGFNENGYWVLGENTLQDKDFVMKLDPDFVPIANMTIDEPTWLNYTIVVSSEYVALAGTLKSSANQGTSIFLKTFTLDGITTDYTENVSLVDVQIGDYFKSEADASEEPCFNNAGTNLRLDIDGVVVSVKNLGNTVLNEVTANTYFAGCDASTCDVTYNFSKQFTNLNLQPNEQMSLDFGDITLLNPELGIPDQICLWLSAPNQKIDDNIDNNYLCKNLPQPILNATHVKVNNAAAYFPNPVYSELTIRLEKPLKDKAIVYIYDMASKQVRQQKLENSFNQTSMIIDMAGLPTGMYLVCIFDEEIINRMVVVKA